MSTSAPRRRIAAPGQGLLVLAVSAALLSGETAVCGSASAGPSPDAAPVSEAGPLALAGLSKDDGQAPPDDTVAPGSATELALPADGATGGDAVPRVPVEDVVAAVAGAWSGPGLLAVAAGDVLEPGRTGRTGRTATPALAGNGDLAARPFPTASMVKLFLAEDLLHRARTGAIALDAADRDRIAAMLRASDDPAASSLWVRYGGNQMVVDVAARYGLTGTSPTPVPGQWGQVMTTAADLARFLALLPVTAHPDDAATILAGLREAVPTAADGFDQRFGVFALRDEPVRGPVAVKQGWMCCVGGQRHVHSVGVVGGTAVVLLSETGRGVGYDGVRAALSAAARAVPPLP